MTKRKDENVRKLLSKSLLVLLMLVCSISTPGMTAPAEDFADPYVPVSIRQSDGSLVKTPHTGFVSKHEALVPLAVVTDYLRNGNGLTLSAGRTGLSVSLERPAFEMETAELTTYLQAGVDFQLNATPVMGAPMLNLKGLEKFFQIAIERAQPGEPLIVRKLPGPAVGRSANQLKAKRPPFNPNGKISLVWDHVLAEQADLAREEKIPGLTVISPTWFAVTDSSGTVASRAEWKYVQDAHDKGYKVWPLISNSFDPDMTKAFLADEAAQDRAIRQLLLFTALYDLDGINIDFENVYDDDKDRLTSFVAKLTDKLRQQGMVMSIDATVPSGVPMWSNCYDRAALGKIVDYFMVMTYDEHWRTSPVAGSVASLGWVERGIQSTLQYVPKEKLLMGVPFYTREWRETDLGNGRVRVRASTMWMSDVENRIAQHGLTPRWLDSAGQYYIEYADADYRYKVWIEDAKSLALKVELANKYELAGVAAWRKGFEKEGIWSTIQLALDQPASPAMVEPFATELADWSLKSLMQKAKQQERKGASQ